MSFSKEVKKILMKVEEKSDDERRAKLAGILRGAGSLGISREGISFEVNTENEELSQKTTRLIKSLYRTETELYSEQHKLNNTELFAIAVSPPESERILFDLKLLSLDAEGEKTLCGLDAAEFTTVETAKQFLAGMFLGCGSVSVPDNGSDGYHLEFITQSEETAGQLAHLLAEFDLMPKKVARKTHFVVYLKESEAICDFFAFLGAGKVVLELQSIMTERMLSNTLNRQANCTAANIDKTMMASVRQVEAIELIVRTIGLDALSPQLREIAFLRVENPTDSLDELVEKLNGSVSKSGVNHRFRKLIKIAKDLGGSQNDL